MNENVLITIHEAKHLMDVLENDIPSWEKSKIALLLLAIAANPSLVKDGKSILAGSQWEGRTNSPSWYDDAYGDYYGY